MAAASPTASVSWLSTSRIQHRGRRWLVAEISLAFMACKVDGGPPGREPDAFDGRFTLIADAAGSTLGFCTPLARRGFCADLENRVLEPSQCLFDQGPEPPVQAAEQSRR
jgi:hypothetical protein